VTDSKKYDVQIDDMIAIGEVFLELAVFPHCACGVGSFPHYAFSSNVRLLYWGGKRSQTGVCGMQLSHRL
jgi:hypothetical protein